MSKWRTLLVPLDGTSKAAVALPPARTLAAATGAKLTLVRVVPDLASEEEMAAAAHQLDRVAAELASGGILVTKRLRAGSLPDQLLAAIEHTGADAVVMGTHGRSGVQRALLGSIAEQVLVASPVPVLLVRTVVLPTPRALTPRRRLTASATQHHATTSQAAPPSPPASAARRCAWTPWVPCQARVA
jgi:nucleotide-binding universal stress UspA family protein